jgi:translation initiation factor IF-2
MMELKANPKEMATGVVIEAKMSKGHGATALVLIENGTLKLGDPVAIGSSYGRVRILEDFTNRSIQSAGPSFPVRVAGLKTLPNFGDRLLVFENEKEAKENAVQAEKQIVPKLRIATAKKMTEEETEEKINILTIILKSDVRGSLEAIRKMVGEISAEGAEIHIISEGVGAISESDVTMAKATGAHIFGFRVKELGAAKKIAEKEDVSVHIFNVIYELVDKVKEELANLLPPEIIEEELGRGKVLAIFRDDKKGFVAGGKVESGRVSIGSEIKILQNNNEKYRNKIVTLRKEKSEAKECLSGTECGFGLPPHANVAVGDTFIVFKTEKKKRVVQ